MQEIVGSHGSTAFDEESCNKSKNPRVSSEELFRRLTEELQFETKIARLCVQNGVAAHLLRLVDDGFVCSEDDPLVFMVVDINNQASTGYANSGNYGLPAGHPALLPWPNGQVPVQIEQGVVALPPGALGKFVASIPEVTEKSVGENIVFHLPHLGVLNDVRNAVLSKPQFAMYGPSLEHLLQGPRVQRHQCPVKFFTLARMDGQPRLYDVYYLE